MASAPSPWTYFLIIDSLARFERDMDEIRGGDASDDEPKYNLGTKLELYSYRNEHAVFVNEPNRALAEMLLEMKAEPPPPAGGCNRSA